MRSPVLRKSSMKTLGGWEWDEVHLCWDPALVGIKILADCVFVFFADEFYAKYLGFPQWFEFTYWLKWVPSSTWSKAKELSELTLVSFCAKVIPSFASCQAWNGKTKLNFELTERSHNVENKVSLPTDSARAEMTFPRVVKLLLMLAPSFSLVPLAPVDSALSDPEKPSF